MNREDLIAALTQGLQDLYGETWERVWEDNRKAGRVILRSIVTHEFMERCFCTTIELERYLPRDRCTLLHANEMYEVYTQDGMWRVMAEDMKAYLDEYPESKVESITSEIMFTATISGNIGRDAEVKTFGQKSYISFSLAVKSGKDESTTWVKVMQYSSNPDKFAAVLRKGTGVVCSGRLSVGVYQGKPDITLWADNVEVTKFADDCKASAKPARREPDDLPF